MALNKSNVLKKNRNIKQKTDLTQLFKLIYEKKGFFSLILLTLVIQLYITYYISENIDIEKNEDTTMFGLYPKEIIAFVAAIIIIIILTVITMPSWLKFIFFSLFSSAFGVILGYRKSYYDPNTIKTAFLGTISIFVSMFAFGVALIASNIQLGYMFGLGLFFALLFLLIISIVQFFIIQSSFLYKILVICSLMLFSVYIIYDTNSILQRNYGGDFISASLAYYLDIINIFSDLLSISNFDE
jgi:FtsH-binding integral membrane protein